MSEEYNEPIIDGETPEDRDGLLLDATFEYFDSLSLEGPEDLSPLDAAILLLLDLARSHEKSIAELKAQIQTIRETTAEAWVTAQDARSRAGLFTDLLA